MFWSFILSVIICWLITFISPSARSFASLFSWISFLDDSIMELSCSIAVSIWSYSSFVCSYACLLSSISSFTIVSLFWSSSRAVLSFSVSRRNAFTSSFFNSFLNARYFLAVSDCSLSGPTCFSSSLRMSLTRLRLSLSASSDFSAAALFFLNFTIPAASSKSSRLSSGLPLRIFSIWPCPMIE